MKLDFQTNRLRIRPGTLDDVNAFHAIWTDAGVRRYLWDDVLIDLTVAEAVVQESMESFVERGIGQWLVYERKDDAPLGFCGLRALEDSPEVELLYGILPAYWGRGLAVEASSALLDHAFNTVGLPYVLAEMDAPNAASARVAEKIGMRFEKEYMRNNLPTLRYRIDAAAWHNRK
jgi:RimJ/RimL family protein N-acetyltransferase